MKKNRRKKFEGPYESSDIEKPNGVDEQFTTNVWGGYVHTIVNAAQGAVVTLKTSIFGDVKQLLIFLLFLFSVGFGIGYWIWSSNQPAVMTGDFNIAVAEFKEIPDSGKLTVSPFVSQQIFNFLDTEYQLRELSLDVQVLHDNIGIIEGGAEAKKLAEKTHADIVIYGTIAIAGDFYSISPKFYIADSFRLDAGEFTGQHQLSLPVEFSIEDTATIGEFESPANKELRNRTLILVEFTKGLTYLAAHVKTGAESDVLQSLEAIKDSIRIAEEYENLDGKEVFYLFASHLSRLLGDHEGAQRYIDQAFEANPHYGRAYIAQANIFYDRLEFEKALPIYETALDVEEQPFDYYLFEKAHLGIANIYNYWFQAEPNHEEYAKESNEHFQYVIASYEETENPSLQEMAALAYYGSGIIHQINLETCEAIADFEQTIQLTQSNHLGASAKNRLDMIGPCNE